MYGASEFKCGRNDDVIVTADSDLFLYNLGARASRVKL